MLHHQKKECNVCPDRTEETSRLADFNAPEQELTLLALPDTFQEERQHEQKGKGEEDS